MKRALVIVALFAFVGAAPALSGKPLPSETSFVQNEIKDLNSRYATTADAEKGGYFRYTNEDATGAISYVNLQDWNSAADPAHPQPSQLWYDANGRLIGADFSVPLNASNRASAPNLWGLKAARWNEFKGPHVHWIFATGNGMSQYSHAVGGKAFAAGGGSIANPSAQTLVKMGKIKSASAVSKIFTFPAQWDTEIWLVPNPLGAFAEKNPLVHPSKNAAKGEM